MSLGETFKELLLDMARRNRDTELELGRHQLHAICDPCWRERKGARTANYRTKAPIEICCFCGNPTVDGIYTEDAAAPTPRFCNGVEPDGQPKAPF